jgi:fatty-acyl-CoA synthase
MSPTLVESVFATWFAGGVPVLLPPGRAGEGVGGTRHRLEAAGAGLLLVDSAGPGVDVADLPCRAVEMRSLDGAPYVVDSPTDTAVVQFTSGSTDRPKAIRISHRAVLGNLAAIHHAIELDADRDVAMSWLPLYHDMGFVGTFLGAAVVGLEAAYASTERFAFRPGLWMRACSELGATILAGSDHALLLAARALRRGRELDLSRVRVAMCGGEIVRRSTLDEFEACARPYGWSPTAFMPCYGLAEATLAVTMASASARPTIDTATTGEGGVVARASSADPLVYRSELGTVGVGAPVAGCEVRIAEQEGPPVEGRVVGEILVRSNALMDGYETEAGLDTSTIVDGWLATGDLGYLWQGELFVCGRLKEMIIVNGRNVAPTVFEQVASGVPGVRMSGTAAFAVATDDGGEAAVLAVEQAVVGAGAAELALAVGRHLVDQLGFRPRRIVVVRPGALPRTTSGKVQRTRARAALGAGELEMVAEHRS